MAGVIHKAGLRLVALLKPGQEVVDGVLEARQVFVAQGYPGVRTFDFIQRPFEFLKACFAPGPGGQPFRGHGQLVDRL